MRNVRLALFALCPLALASCGESSSSSISSAPSSSSEPSSSSVEVLPSFAMNLHGDVGVLMNGAMDDSPVSAGFNIFDADIRCYTDLPPAGIGDFLDYQYYRVAQMKLDLAFASAQAFRRIGHVTTLYDLDAANVTCFEKEGDFYADFSSLDFGKLQLDNPRIRFPDAFSFLLDEDVQYYASIFSMANINVGTLFRVSEESPALEEAITMEPYDEDTFCVSVKLTKKVVEELVSIYGTTEGERPDLSSLQIKDGTTFSILYGAKDQVVEELRFTGEIAYSLQQTVFDMELSQIGFTFDGTLSWHACLEEEIPDLEGYVDFEIPKEEEGSSTSSEEN